MTKNLNSANLNRQLKARTGATQFLMKTPPRADEDAATSGNRDGIARARYNFTRAMNLMGIAPLIAAERA
jgi:hypothetical protein